MIGDGHKHDALWLDNIYKFFSSSFCRRVGWLTERGGFLSSYMRLASTTSPYMTGEGTLFPSTTEEISPVIHETCVHGVSIYDGGGPLCFAIRLSYVHTFYLLVVARLRVVAQVMLVHGVLRHEHLAARWTSGLGGIFLHPDSPIRVLLVVVLQFLLSGFKGQPAG